MPTAVALTDGTSARLTACCAIDVPVFASPEQTLSALLSQRLEVLRTRLLQPRKVDDQAQPKMAETQRSTLDRR
jgi:hypothetical protein